MNSATLLEWIAGFARVLLIVGAAVMVVVMTRPDHHPLIMLPLVARIGLAILSLVALTALQVRVNRWQQHRRARRV